MNLYEVIKDRSVALVGNAESLFSKGLGSYIDSYDLVVRLNLGIEIKDSFQQGSKTDLWAIYHSYIPMHLKIRNSNYIIDSKYILCMKYIHPKDIAAGINIKNNLPLPTHDYDELEHRLLIQKFGYDNISMGLLILDYVYNRHPKNIGIFGFDWKVTKTWYHDGGEEAKDKESITHDWEKEKKYIDKIFLPEENIKLF